MPHTSIQLFADSSGSENAAHMGLLRLAELLAPSLCLRSSLIGLFKNRIKVKGGASESVRINVNSLVDCSYQYSIAMHTAALQHLPFRALILPLRNKYFGTRGAIMSTDEITSECDWKIH